MPMLLLVVRQKMIMRTYLRQVLDINGILKRLLRISEHFKNKLSESKCKRNFH